MKNEDERLRVRPGGLLQVIRKRPPLYLGVRSISALWNFIQGYSLALRDHDLSSTHNVLPRKFHDWVTDKFGFKNSRGSVRDMILAQTNHDEAAAFETFFQLYDEFRAEHESGGDKAD